MSRVDRIINAENSESHDTMKPIRRRHQYYRNGKIGPRKLAIERLETRRVLASVQGITTSNGVSGSDSLVAEAVSASDAIQTENRIMIPTKVVGPQVIPGDGRPVAILFRAELSTEVLVHAIGRVSLNQNIQLLNETLDSVPDSAVSASALRSPIEAGSLYALIFNGTNAQAEFQISTVDGPLAVTGSVDTNLLQPEDVDANGAFSPLDVLIVINEIARVSEGESVNSLDGVYADVDSDGEISVTDALRVLSLLAIRQEQGNGFQYDAFDFARTQFDDDDHAESELPGLGTTALW